MSERGMYVSEYAETVRAAIESSTGIKTELFAGQFTEDDLKSNINVPKTGKLILVTVAGGALKKGIRQGEIESVVGGGALVIARADKNANGYSKESSEITQRILGVVSGLKLPAEKMPNTFVPVEFGVESSGFRNNTDYSVWSCIWQQTLILKTN